MKLNLMKGSVTVALYTYMEIMLKFWGLTNHIIIVVVSENFLILVFFLFFPVPNLSASGLTVFFVIVFLMFFKADYRRLRAEQKIEAEKILNFSARNIWHGESLNFQIILDLFFKKVLIKPWTTHGSPVKIYPWQLRFPEILTGRHLNLFGYSYRYTLYLPVN